MLRRLTIVCVIFCFANGAWSQVPGNGGRQDQKPQGGQQASQSKPAIATVQIQQATDKEKQSANSKPHDYPWRELLAPANAPNAILAIIGFFGIIAALLTLGAIRKQAKAQMDADRAWIVVSVAGQPEEPLTFPRSRAIPGIVWKIAVTGNTPARIIEERYRCRTVPITDGKLELEKIPTYLSNANAINDPVVFAPGYEYGMNIPVEPTPDNLPTSTQMAAVISGVRAFCAYGLIEYQDAFGRSGKTQFCAIYRPRIGGTMKSPDGTDLNPPGFRISGPEGYNYNT